MIGRDTPPPPAAGLTVLALLAFAGGFICGVILTSAVRPVRVVRFWSVPPDAIPACDVPGATKGAH